MRAKNEPVSATERMEASRRTSRMAVTRELLFVAILSRLWSGSHRCHVPTGERAICLHTPAGPLVWRLIDDEEPTLFDHLPYADADSSDPKGRHKLAMLLHLATEGWTQ